MRVKGILLFALLTTLSLALLVTMRDATAAPAPASAPAPADAASAKPQAAGGRKIDFNRDVRPILSDNCYFCHGPDAAHREADLRLDTREGLFAVKDDVAAVVPGKIDDSVMWMRITSDDAEYRMPHESSNKTLTSEQIETIKLWIEQGAEWNGHWSYIPPQRPTPPKVDDLPPAFVKNPIDAFIGAKLKELKLAPSPEADRVTLIRRLSFDLTGLPPTPAEVDAFVNDKSSDAYEKLVERLLASPHFGERMTVHWMDLVRYADTIGFHSDNPREVWPYRDWLIEAFNENKAYDDFTREQLAGDLLPNATRDQKVASAYNRLLLTTGEGGAQAKEYVKKYEADRVRNVSTVWMGATMGCAQCHDHKFDPYTAKDFYRMAAFFADIQEPAIKLPEPELMLPTAKQEADQKRLDTAIAGVTKLMDTPTPELAAAQVEWEKTKLAEIAAAPKWTPLKITSASTEAVARTIISRNKQRVFVGGGKTPETDVYTVMARTKLKNITAFKLEALPHEKLPARGPGKAPNGNFVVTEFDVVAESKPADTTTNPAADAATSPRGNTAPNPGPDAEAKPGPDAEAKPGPDAEAKPGASAPGAAGPTSRPVAFQSATATHEQAAYADGENPYRRWPAVAAIDGDKFGPKWGWAILDQTGQANHAVFETAADIGSGEELELTFTIKQNLGDQHTLGHFALYATDAARPVRADQDLGIPPQIAKLIQIEPAKRNDAQKEKIAAYYRSVSKLLDAPRAELARLNADRAALIASIPKTLTSVSGPPRITRVLDRGDWQDEKGEIVAPGVPAFMKQIEVPVDRGPSRLDLANWLVARDNPLTARAFVNRFWKMFYGNGLAKPLDDLGAQGEWPTHPELLDWLAVEFMESGWDMKHMVRLMVTSGTYRQSSNQPKPLREADPYNKWLARQTAFRLDAEFVRDNALAISGLLVKKTGGPSVKPYQPAGYWEFLNFPKREYVQDTGEKLYRRGMYTWWQRMFLHPSLLNFDAPAHEECTAERTRSNTPQQALTLLNDVTYVESARVFAARIMTECDGDTPARISWAFKMALSREPTPQELPVLKELFEKQRQRYLTDVPAADALTSAGEAPDADGLRTADLAAWTSVARTILNLHETITRN